MQRILVIRPGALGDTILTLPALAALRAAFPGAHLTFAGNPPLLPLLRGSAYADAVISIDDAALTPLFAPLEQPSLPLAPCLAGLDLAVLWLGDSAAVAGHLRRLGARAVVAARSRQPAESRRHAADYLLATLAPALPARASRAEAPYPRLSLSAEQRAFAERFSWQHRLSGRLVAAIHPGSGGRWKCWPAARFAALADRLAGRGMAILLVVGPADDETAGAFVAALRVARPLVARGLALANLAAVLSLCAVFVGNDSGVSHLAAALGVPTVAVYGPTDPLVWGVRGERVALLRGERLEVVSVAEVQAAVDTLLL